MKLKPSICNITRQNHDKAVSANRSSRSDGVNVFNVRHAHNNNICDIFKPKHTMCIVISKGLKLSAPSTVIEDFGMA